MSLLANLGQFTTIAAHSTFFGKLIAASGPIVRADLPGAKIGGLCFIESKSVGQESRWVPAQVVSFEKESVSLAPFDGISGLGPGSRVRHSSQTLRLAINNSLVGKVLDAFARPLPSEGVLPPPSEAQITNGRQVDGAPPAPLSRRPINTQLVTGVALVDSLLSIGYGQRIGLFAGPGLGKSTLLGAMARQARVDLTVIALVGERGREVIEFIDDVLGVAGRERCIVVVSTSDESPLRRSLAASTATTIAEHFRDQGKNVLLLVDSLTRVARAVREVSLAAGELPVRQGFTSSVYTHLPKLVERAGTCSAGSITALYTVLTQANEESDPLGEEIKSLLDGHLILSSLLAERGVRPAIDASASISRLFSKLHGPPYLKSSSTLSAALARLKRDRDLVLLGGNPDVELSRALELEPEILELFARTNATDFEETIVPRIESIARRLGGEPT